MAMIFNSRPKLVGTEKMACGKKRKISTDDHHDIVALLLNSQPKVLLRTKNMTCGKRRKISTDNDHHTLIDVNKELEKDNKVLRAAMLKKRYANVIIKSQQLILGEAFNGEEMKKKAKLWDKQLQEEKAKSQRQKDREAARIAIASMKRTVDFDDGLQAEKELLAIIGSTNRW